LIGTYSISNELGSSARNSTLLNNDGTLTGKLSNDTGDSLESSHVGRAASTDTTVLCRGVDGDEDNVSLADGLADIGGEEQVAGSHPNLSLVGVTLARVEDDAATAIAGYTDDVAEARLVDGRVLRVPAADSSDVAVDDGHLDVRVLECDDSSGRATWK
jgi:hypothetical protein